jgi:4-alpha-glucanotransferase
MASERKREVGVLCHITSLAGGGPHGTLSAAAEFIDKLSKSGCSVWQMLPLTPPDEHASPYASSSAFAAWAALAEDTNSGQGVKPENGCRIGENRIEWEKKESHWLDDWSLYSAIKKAQNNQPWTKWPALLRDRDPEAIAEQKLHLSDEIKDEKNAQLTFMQSWNAMRNYSAKKGVRLFGDLPFFIAHDSADVWANRHLFHLNPDGSPSLVAGVPPDYFSEKGQRWGTMLYDWDEHRGTGFAWWKARMTRMFNLFDMVRIDHFRALEASWSISATDSTAEHGAWQEGPGDELLQAIMEVIPNGESDFSSDLCQSGLVAEDLGIIPPSVVAIRRRFGIPGMAVLQFGFDDDNTGTAVVDDVQSTVAKAAVSVHSNPNHPASICYDQIAYTGTHDNDTTVGWWSSSPDVRRCRLQKYATSYSRADLNSEPSSEFSTKTEAMSESSAVQSLIQMALNSTADIAIVPVQDIAALGSEARMNTPGTEAGNWRWRLEAGIPDEDDWIRFANQIQESGRGGQLE